jgi:hypothetical protein
MTDRLDTEGEVGRLPNGSPSLPELASHGSACHADLAGLALSAEEQQLLVACKVKELAPGDVVTTLPDGEVIYYRDPSHRYWHLTLDGKRPLVSVSTVLNVLDKPGLLSWVREITLQGENYWEVRDASATRGTSVHSALEALATEGTIPKLADFPEEDRGYVQALAGWWLEAKPEVIASEVIVASLEHNFAGRFDLRCRIDGKVTLLDAKTSKRVYPTTHFAQLEAYEGASVESGYDPTDQRMVLRLGGDGVYETAVSCASYSDFLGIKAAFDAQKRVEAAHKLILKEAA